MGMLVFLVQGIDIMAPMTRHWVSLGLTGTMAAIGFFCLRTLDEKHGARTFLTLATAMVPIHFSQLGAMTYSLFLTSPTELPAMLAFSVIGIGTLALNIGATLAVIIPLALLGFALLSRHKFQPMTMLYLLINALLMIPLRQPELMMVVATIQVLLVEFIDKTMISTHYSSRRYGFINRTLLWLPVFITLGRTTFYDPSMYFVGFSLGIVAYILLHVIPKVGVEWGAEASRSIGTLVGATAWLVIGTKVSSDLGNDKLFPLVAIMPMSLIFFYGSALSKNMRGFFKVVANGTLLIGLISLIAFEAHQATIALTGISTGLALIAWSWNKQSYSGLLSGSFSVLIGIFALCHMALSFYASHAWIALALTGCAIVLIASFVEKRSDRIEQAWLQVKSW
jgi:hypothetical protein